MKFHYDAHWKLDEEPRYEGDPRYCISIKVVEGQEQIKEHEDLLKDLLDVYDFKIFRDHIRVYYDFGSTRVGRREVVSVIKRFEQLIVERVGDE